MIKVKALREFTYGDFDKIENLQRNNKDRKEEGRLYEKDTFECTKKMADYLTGGCGYVLVKVIEIIPEEITLPDAEITFSKEEVKPKATVKKTKKTRSKK